MFGVVLPLLGALLARVHSQQCPGSTVCDNVIALCAGGVQCINPSGANLGGCCAVATTATTQTTQIVTDAFGSTIIVTAATGAATRISSGTSNATATNSSCVDLLNPLTGSSDCPGKSFLCTNPVYLTVMQQQCPRTCGFCTTSGSSTSTNSTITSCVDLTNPNTGTSDCPNRRALCTNAAYTSLMRIQCPATCGFCTGSGSTSTNITSTATSTNGTCVDLLNPQTGASDCPSLSFLCTNANYTAVMAQQCPLTCGLCTTGKKK